MPSGIAERSIHCYTRGQKDITCSVPESIKILEDGEGENYQDRKTFGMFRVLTQRSGDKRIIWNKMVMAEIDAARRMFYDLIKQGMTPFVVGTDGQRTSEMIKDFDPLLEEVIFIPTRALMPG